MRNNKQRWVIKAGSSLVSGKQEGINAVFIKNLVCQVHELIKNNIEVIIVSSGAIAKGMFELNLKERPATLNMLQATAAVGQVGLINNYERAFSKLNLKTAQVLVSHDDIADRERYLNSRRSLQALIALGVIPIINENDSVATEEITFGDNDMLAGALAGLVSADKLIILTDQKGICESDPKVDKLAKLIPSIDFDNKGIDLEKIMESSSGVLGRGGIKTKIKACKLAVDSGAEAFVVDGREKDTLNDVLKGKNTGTSLVSKKRKLASRKLWIASQGSPSGSIVIDQGAVNAISLKGGSLLPVGVKDVQGEIKRGSLIICLDSKGSEVARGLSNFNSEELMKIRGKRSEEVLEELGYPLEEEVVHRDNLILS